MIEKRVYNVSYFQQMGERQLSSAGSHRLALGQFSVTLDDWKIIDSEVRKLLKQ
jgi:hypothetical protein